MNSRLHRALCAVGIAAVLSSTAAQASAQSIDSGSVTGSLAGVSTGSVMSGGQLNLGSLTTNPEPQFDPTRDCPGLPEGTPRCAETGDIVEVSASMLRPTQPAVGMDQIDYKLGRYTSDKDELRGKVNKRFDDYCEDNGFGEAVPNTVTTASTLQDPASFECDGDGDEDDLKTIVVGPGGDLYLTDGHHTFLSYASLPDAGPEMTLRVRVQSNNATMSEDEFWDSMIERKLVWLKDVEGIPITPAELPTTLDRTELADDPWRSLVYLTRGIGYEKSGVEYAEFYWAEALKAAGVDFDETDTHSSESFLAAVERASRAEVDLPSDTAFSNGLTAEDMGQMAQWNDGKAAHKGDFGKLGAPYSDDKPGKIAYIMHYQGRA